MGNHGLFAAMNYEQLSLFNQPASASTPMDGVSKPMDGGSNSTQFSHFDLKKGDHVRTRFGIGILGHVGDSNESIKLYRPNGTCIYICYRDILGYYVEALGNQEFAETTEVAAAPHGVAPPGVAPPGVAPLDPHRPISPGDRMIGWDVRGDRLQAGYYVERRQSGALLACKVPGLESTQFLLNPAKVWLLDEHVSQKVSALSR